MNRYLISVDIEGITGVSTKDYSSSKGSRYSLGCQFMAHDVNAVAKGILLADPDAEIIVRDAHSGATNLNLSLLHPKIQLIQGWDGSMNMVYPVDSSYKAVLLVGYHAGAPNTRGVLSHTYGFQSVKVNDLLINEAGMAALYAGAVGVPVIFVSGDDQSVIEARQQIPQIYAVEVKKSINRHCSISLSLEETEKKLSVGASEAVKLALAGKVNPFQPKTPVQMQLEFHTSSYGPSVFQDVMDLLSFDSFYKFNYESRSVEYTTSTQLEAYQRMLVLSKLMHE